MTCPVPLTAFASVLATPSTPACKTQISHNDYHSVSTIHFIPSIIVHQTYFSFELVDLTPVIFIAMSQNICVFSVQNNLEVEIHLICLGVDILVNMAKSLVKDSESWYLSLIFHSLFYKLISIIYFLLQYILYDMGVKTSARLRLHRE